MVGLSTRRAAGVITIGAVALALALSGCQSAVDLEEQAGEEENVEPVQGGTLTVAQSSDAQPNNLQAGRAGNFLWAANVFENLTRVDDDGAPQPLLATEWEVADDGLSMDLTVRDDVTFHSGRPMTAEDVKFSIEYTATSASQVAYLAKKISGIEVTSDNELTLTFAEPIPNIFDLFEYMFIVDSESVAGLADGSAVIGTGPFLFESWSPGSEITLTRNDDYWGESAYLDGIEIAVITDSTAMLNAVRSDRVQVAFGMNAQDVKTVGSSGGFDVVTVSGSVYPLGVDVEAPPFDNPDVRQAVQIAIDRERIGEQVFGDSATPTNLFWDGASKAYPEDLKNAYPYDPELAAQMIEDAGATGTAVEISVISIPNNTSVAEIVRNNLEEAGLAPTINVVETQAFGDQQIAGELGAMFMPLHGLNGLSPVTLMEVLPSLREGNASHFWTDEYAQLREDLATATEDDYADALEALSAYIVDEAFTANIVRVDGQAVEATDVHGLDWSIRAYLDAGSAFIAE
jgi:peptide/nickel transport system substrate-binding protein